MSNKATKNDAASLVLMSRKSYSRLGYTKVIITFGALMIRKTFLL